MLKVQNIVSGYGKAVVVQGVDLEIQPQELVTIIGPNGSGKSTLLKSVAGLVRIFSGSINYKDKDITGNPTSKMPSLGIGYVPQLNNVFPNLTIMENLEIASLFLEAEQFEDGLARVFRIFPVLEERKNQRAKKLSGGERQMLAIGRSLMVKPDLLLLDEPTAALAPVLVTEILKIVLDLKEKENIAILLVEQNARKSLEISNRTYILVAGQIFKTGDSQEILNDPDIGQAFLGLKTENEC
ncbi:MAG: ABC transporter ATP-binding protein [Candidatus Hodarchaeota archaeon]